MDARFSCRNEKLPDPMSIKGTFKDLITDGVAKEISGLRDFKDVDMVFIAMHGPYGEDGTIQGMLDMLGLRYTGSGVLSSAIGMDKLIFRKLLELEGIAIPKYVVVKKGEGSGNVKKILGGPSYFVKPHNQGSSVGASIVKKISDLPSALKQTFKYSDTALIDEYIRGKEVTCAVMGNKKPLALPLVEIIPAGEFFDYKSKYADEGTQEIVPARISKVLMREIQSIAIKVYRVVGCKGFARVDFILKDDKYPLVLEINTIPGLTPMSLFPKAAKAAGISYSKLLEKIINYALE